MAAIKERHQGDLIVSGAGELAHALVGLGLVDELWFWVSPWLWPAGPRIFDGAGPVRLELIGSTTFASGVLRLAYRPARPGAAPVDPGPTMAGSKEQAMDRDPETSGAPTCAPPTPTASGSSRPWAGTTPTGA